jgi:hypothetical protein
MIGYRMLNGAAGNRHAYAARVTCGPIIGCALTNGGVLRSCPVQDLQVP